MPTTGSGSRQVRAMPVFKRKRTKLMAGTRLVTIITVIINNSSNTVMVTLRPWDSWARKGLCSYRPLIPMPSEWTKAPWEWQLQKQPYIFALKRPRGNTGFLRAEGEAEWAKAAQFVRLSFLTRPWLSCNVSCVSCFYNKYFRAGALGIEECRGLDSQCCGKDSSRSSHSRKSNGGTLG